VWRGHPFEQDRAGREAYLLVSAVPKSGRVC
jgi:hypothetical protein